MADRVYQIDMTANPLKFLSSCRHPSYLHVALDSSMFTQVHDLTNTPPDTFGILHLPLHDGPSRHLGYDVAEGLVGYVAENNIANNSFLINH